MPADQTNQRQEIQLAPGALQFFEQVSLRYDAEIPQAVTPQDLLNPAFWAHHAVRLRPMNEIRARAIDGTWIADLVVLDCSRTWARVHILAVHRLTTGQVAETQASEQDVKAYIEGHKVVYRGQHKWSITRNSDKAVIEEGIAEQDVAKARLEALARSHVGGAALPAASVTA